MKKNNIFSKILLGAFFISSLVSCDSDMAEFPDTSDEKPVVSNVGETSFNLLEGESATIELAVSQPIAKSIFVLFKPVSGDASFSDFNIGDGSRMDDNHTGGPDGYVVEIPPYTDSFTTNIDAVFDILPEGTETVEMEMVTYLNRAAIVEGEAIAYDLTINNFEANDFDITFSWDGTYVDEDGETQDLCDIDFDMELYDAGFSNIANSYSSCPENFYIGEGVLPDGTYYLVSSLYSTNGATFEEPIDFPAMLTFTKVGISQEILDLSDMWNSTDGGFIEGNGSYDIVHVITISNGTYTVEDFNTGDVIFSARGNNPIQTIREGYPARKQAYLNSIKN